MIIISTKENKKIPYHEKVIQAYNTLINSIHPELITTNPIISGSNAIKYIYAPKSISNDIDLYFQTEADYNKAFILLKETYSGIFETNNAASFNTIKVQLIKKDFLSPQELILSHDLVNVACAITSDKIYTTQNTHYSWYNQEIVLQNFQLGPDPSDEERLTKLTILLGRISKYQERYQLSLSNSLKSFLYEQMDFLTAHPNISYAHVYNEILLDYYGRPIVEDFYTSSTTKQLICRLLQIESLFGWEVDQSTFC